MKNRRLPAKNQKAPKKNPQRKGKESGSFSFVTWFFIVFLALATMSFLYSTLSQPRTYTVMPAERVSQGRKGQGTFIFYEYAPLAYQGVDFSKSGMDTEIRYREGAALAPLSPTMKSRIQAQLKLRKNLKEEKNKTEDQHEILRTVTDLYSPSFRIRPYPYKHNYPRLGDHQAVEDLSEKGRDWEEAYLEKVIESNQILSGPYGRIQLAIDGFENLLTPASLMSLEPGDLSRPILSAPSPSPGLKFVEDRLYYLAVDCPSTVRPRTFAVGKTTDLRLEDGLVLTGKLDMVRKDAKGRELYFFSIREGYEEIKNRRFSSVEILLPVENVYEVPVDCLAKDQGTVYCFLLDQSGKAVKVTVEIAGTRDKMVFIRAEDPASSKKTVLQPYDQLLKNPEKVTEGKSY